MRCGRELLQTRYGGGVQYQEECLYRLEIYVCIAKRESQQRYEERRSSTRVSVCCEGPWLHGSTITCSTVLQPIVRVDCSKDLAAQTSEDLATCPEAPEASIESIQP